MHKISYSNCPDKSASGACSHSGHAIKLAHFPHRQKQPFFVTSQAQLCVQCGHNDSLQSHIWHSGSFCSAAG